MANKDNISLLSKYQMRVLYYKCKEGATHEEIAEKLGRDVNTVQYHMTKIYNRPSPACGEGRINENEVLRVRSASKTSFSRYSKLRDYGFDSRMSTMLSTMGSMMAFT